MMRRLTFASVILVAAAPALAQAPKVGDPPEAKNMRLVGYSDLQARSAYQPVIHKQGNRYIAYIGHHGGTPDIPKPTNKLTGQAEFNGTSIVDVTDAAHPKYLKHLPGLEGTYESGGAQMVRVCDGKTLPKGDPNKFYLLRVFGGQAHEIWDVTDPANPALLTRIPGQEPGSTGTMPVDVHGPISTGPQGNRVYFGYGTNKGGVLQIVDREKLLNGPKEPTPENLRYPVVGQLDMLPINGAHTTVPMLKMPIAEFAKDKGGGTRDIVMIVDEQILNECQEPRQMVFFVDVTVETRPMVISNFNVSAEPGNHCERGGRFGSHSSNEDTSPIFYKKVVFVTWFNGGVRAIDVRDPYQPKQIGYFIPSITEATDKRCIKIDGKDRCKVAIQSNNVETDDRGYVYVVDRANTGMHILELTPEAKKAAGVQ